MMILGSDAAVHPLVLARYVTNLPGGRAWWGD